MTNTLLIGVRRMSATNNRGGKREGAGRKASGKVRATHTLTLSPEAADRLKAQGRDKSEYIDKLIIADIKRG